MNVLTNNQKIPTFKNKLKNIKSTSKLFKKEKNINFINNLIGLNDSRYILKFLVILLTFFILWPLFTLIKEALYGIQKGSIYLTINNLNEIKGTLLLLVFSLTLGGFLGITNGWILANCNFKGRKLLRVLQLIEKLKSKQIRQEQLHLKVHPPLPNFQVFQQKYLEYLKVERHLIHL